MIPKHIKQLQNRSRDLRAHVLNAHTVVVESTTSSTANHVVTVEYDDVGVIHARCTCPWAINGGVACSHVIAALEALAARRGRTLSFWSDYDQARKQKHRTFYLAARRNKQDKNGVWITSRSL